MLFRIRDICPKSVLRSLYFSIFNTHISYGLPVWGTADSLYIDRVNILQKKDIRAITFSEFRAHSAPLLKDLNILTINDLFQVQISSLMWDLDHDILPKSLASYFIRRKHVHHHETRHAIADKLCINKTNTLKYGITSFQVQGSQTLNRLLDLDIYKKSITNLSLRY